MSLREVLGLGLENDQASDAPVVRLGGDTRPEIQEQVVELLKAGNTNALVENFSIESLSMETQQIREEQKNQLISSMFVYTPKQSGFASIAEMTASSIKDPTNTVIAIVDGETDEDKFTEDQKKAADIVESIAKQSGAQVFHSLTEATDWVGKRSAGTPDVA